MMNPDDHSGHDPDLRGREPPGGHDHGDYGAQGGPGQLGIIFPAQAQVTSVTAWPTHMLAEHQKQKVKREKVFV